MAQAAESYLSEMQKVAGEDGLADAEIARLLKSVQAAQFKRSEVIPADADSSFKPRSLVEIAFEAEKKRQEDAARQLAVEKAAQLAAQQAENVKENAPENAENAGANQIATQAEVGRQSPDMGAEVSHPADMPETGVMAPAASPQPASAQALSQQQEAEQEAAAAQAYEQREAEDASLRAQAEEEGYKRGFESGLEAARSAEPTEEEKAHAAAKEQERADIISRLETVIAAAASAEAVDVSELVPVLEQAVLRLASERAGLAIRENPQGLVQRIEHLVEKVKSGAKAISVTLHPDDLKAVNTWRPTVSAHSAWTWRADASFVSGDIQLKLDGITVIDLLGTDTGIRPADRAESLLSAPTPVMQAEEELPEQPIEELQAEELQAEQPEPPLSEEPHPDEPHPDEPLIAQSAEAMGERETKGESQAEGEAEAEAETEALAEKSGLDVDNPTS
jgi:flagellar biosynthesis/type III secretory pathway protein FliH